MRETKVADFGPPDVRTQLTFTGVASVRASATKTAAFPTEPRCAATGRPSTEYVTLPPPRWIENSCGAPVHRPGTSVVAPLVTAYSLPPRLTKAARFDPA